MSTIDKPLPLAELQRLLFRLIVAPEGVSEELKGDAHAARVVERMIRTDARLSAVERLEIYARMYFFRLRDLLASDFPKLSAALGEVEFHNLMVRYLSAAPSLHPSVAKLGRPLCDYLAAHGDPERPWLADLAALEWARARVFDRADAEPLTLETLRRLPPEQFAGRTLRLVPAHELVKVAFSIDELWSALDRSHGEDSVPPPVLAPRDLLVWREGHDAVYHRPLDLLERECLVLLASGASFGQICDAVIAHLGEETATEQAFSLLQRWLSEQLLTLE